MKKINSYDVLFIFFFLALLFTLGYHSVANNSTPEKETVNITVAIEKLKGFPQSGELCYADNRHQMTVLYVDGNLLHLVCKGNFYEAGFLLEGAKYLSENQPLKLYGEWGGVEGRILVLSKKTNTL